MNYAKRLRTFGLVLFPTMYEYYIIDNMGSPKDDLPAGPRIFGMPVSNPFRLMLKGAEGPYQSISELRNNSILFHRLLSNNPRRAQQICSDRFVVLVHDQVFVPAEIDDDLNGKLFQMLEHAISGDVSGRKVSGVHYYQPGFHKIVEITKDKNRHGVWEARIEALQPKIGKWVLKRNLSTFFPLEWSKEQLVFKIYRAFKTKIDLSPTKYIGTTDCGIRVIFILKEGKIVSIYPLYD